MKIEELSNDEMLELKRIAVENIDDVRKLKAMYGRQMRIAMWLSLICFTGMMLTAYLCGWDFYDRRWAFFLNFTVATLNLLLVEICVKDMNKNKIYYKQCEVIEYMTDTIVNSIALKKDMEYAQDR